MIMSIIVLIPDNECDTCHHFLEILGFNVFTNLSTITDLPSLCVEYIEISLLLLLPNQSWISVL